MIIDTHCHYNVEPLLSNIENHWQNSLKHNVVGGICIGTDLEDSKIALELSQKFSAMFASIAIHPEEHTEKIKPFLNDAKPNLEQISAITSQELEKFEQLLEEVSANQKIPKLVAIGEIGLDYYRLKSKGLKREIIETEQKKLFARQLELAFEHNLVVILHVRDQIDRTEDNAYYDTYQIVSELVSKYTTENKMVPTIILHCASGPKEYIKNFIELGAYVGFAGNITYENATELREIFEITPANRVLLETDAPYLAPNEKKGEICEPHYITQTAQFLQNTYQLDLDIILSNTLSVFPQFQKVVE